MAIPRRWTSLEDSTLKELVARYGARRGPQGRWDEISKAIPGRTKKDCRKRWFHSLDPFVRKGRWTKEEDAILLYHYSKLGPAWKDIAFAIPGRKDDQCSKRYCEILDPLAQDRLRDWSASEDSQLTALVHTLGSSWTTIATKMKGRPALTCRNRWRAISKKARMIEAASTKRNHKTPRRYPFTSLHQMLTSSTETSDESPGAAQLELDEDDCMLATPSSCSSSPHSAPRNAQLRISHTHHGRKSQQMTSAAAPLSTYTQQNPIQLSLPPVISPAHTWPTGSHTQLQDDSFAESDINYNYSPTDADFQVDDCLPNPSRDFISHLSPLQPFISTPFPAPLDPAQSAQSHHLTADHSWLPPDHIAGTLNMDDFEEPVMYTPPRAHASLQSNDAHSNSSNIGMFSYVDEHSASLAPSISPPSYQIIVKHHVIHHHHHHHHVYHSPS